MSKSKLKAKSLMLIFIGVITTLYSGLFLGDLGGIGGYDGFAPRWLYERINFQPGNDLLFQLAEKGSMVSLALSMILFIVFIACAAISVVQKVKSRATNS